MTEVAKQFNKDAVNQIGLKDLFVINLCASMTPMPEVPKQLKGYEKHKLYQISKIEDGRRRYRLRLGFFSNETDAELLVTSIRMMYPAALVTCAASEDLRYVVPEGSAPNATTEQATVMAAAPVASPAPAAAKPVAATPKAPEKVPEKAPAQASAEPPKAKPAPTIVKTPPAPALELVDPPAPAKAAARPTTDTQIFHVGRGISIPDSSLELTADDLRIPAAASAPKPATPAATVAKPSQPAAPIKSAAAPATVTAPPPKSATPAPVAAKQPITPPAAPAKPAAAAAGPIVAATVQMPASSKQDDYIPILDTTLTIRTLTKAEAEDPNRPKWFVVQLAHSERPIDINTMPKLDIFSAYSLYAVALMEQGGIRHTLRLGFFKEQVSAEAVMGYLKTFFTSPSVVQISAAEHDRFESSQPKSAAKTSGSAEPARSAAVKVVPMAAATKPIITPKTTSPAKAPVSLLRADTSKQGSFLSRLIGKQLD